MTFKEWARQEAAIWRMFEKSKFTSVHYSSMLVEHCNKYKRKWNYGK
jgi:hypothetical protein